MASDRCLARARAQLPPCVGDCSGTRQVTVSNLILGVNIALDLAPVSECPAFDPNNTGQVGIAQLIEAVINAQRGCPGPAGPTPTAGPLPPPTPVIPFMAALDCRQCHPRQFEEWQTSPHGYSGISPSFWSLMTAGQNSRGAGAIDQDGVSIGGGVGNFCAPCHGPQAYIGEVGNFGGNNAGFDDVQPEFPFVCTNLLIMEG